MVGKEAPGWTSHRLPENQLQESMEDNAVFVKRAFEKYIDEQVNKAVPIWRAQLPREEILELSDFITDRLQKLAEGNYLPDIKWVSKKGKSEFRISNGILGELYRCGVTRDQCPNLMALTDYLSASDLPDSLNARYIPVRGKNKAIVTSRVCLGLYFDDIESHQQALTT